MYMRDLSVLDSAYSRYPEREGIELKGTLVAGTNAFHLCPSGTSFFLLLLRGAVHMASIMPMLY